MLVMRAKPYVPGGLTVVLGIFKNHTNYIAAIKRMDIEIISDAEQEFGDGLFETGRNIVVAETSLADLGLSAPIDTDDIFDAFETRKAFKCPPETAVAFLQQHKDKLKAGRSIYIYMDPVNNVHLNESIFEIGLTAKGKLYLSVVHAGRARKWRPTDVFIYDTGNDVPNDPYKKIV